MKLKKRLGASMAVLGCFGIAACWLALGGERLGSAQQPLSKAIAQKAQTRADDRADDRAAIQKAVDAFVDAFKKGDGKAVAERWTNEGEYIGDDGVTFRGRPALQKAYVAFFANNADNSLTVDIDTVRFPSKDTAVVEGHFKLRKPKGELVVSRCSFLYAREDGKWLIAIAREWPSDGLSLRDLEWLIGTWESKRGGAVVSTRYEWTANKSFIRCQFSITNEGQTHTGMQMIGKDPSGGALHVWTFEDNGGIGDTDIVRDGKKWVFYASGVTAEGSIVYATNIFTPIDPDSFMFQSVERTMDDEALPDLPPIKVVRVKGKR